MKKQLRVRARRDFVKVSGSGFFYKTKVVVVQASENSREHFRVGFTASKKVGNAVIRNRCKRRMRAAADVVVPIFGMDGVDYVFIARHNATFSESWMSLVESFKIAVSYLNRRILECKKLRQV